MLAPSVDDGAVILCPRLEMQGRFLYRPGRHQLYPRGNDSSKIRSDEKGMETGPKEPGSP